MTSLNNIIEVNITRQTSTVARASFGVPAIIAQFTTAKTTTAFTRARYYGSLAELSADGWVATDSVYLAAQKLLGQARKPKTFMVGRIDAGDANLTASLDAIQLETSGWYCFGVVGQITATATLSGVLVTGNVVDAVVAGKTVAQQAFSTDHATTMTALAAKIVTALTQTGLATPVATPSGNAMAISQAGRDINSITFAITGGASQATTTVAYLLPQAPTLLAANWVSTQTKLFGYADMDANTLSGAATSDLAYQLKQLAYDRVWGIYHANPAEYAQFAWMGLELAKDPGQSTWAHKTLQGVTPDDITEGALSAASAKNTNTYTPVAGSGRTLWGKASSGENIMVMRNIDYMTSEIQADEADYMFQRDIVPANDKGIVSQEGILKGTLSRMEGEGILQPDSSVTTITKYADWSAADKAAGTNRMSFTAGIQNAILKTIISGTVAY